ncbi:MAG: DinB family protein [Dehalococcoidia bacterium]
MQHTVDQLAATPKALALLVVEATEADLDREPAPGEWSTRTLLAHFRDGEVLEFRLAAERILAEANPALVFIPAGDWAANRNRTRDAKPQLLSDFALQRQASVGILRGLRAEDWERTGVLGDRTVTLRELVRFWAGHDRDHLAQLERLCGERPAEAEARRRRWERVEPD